MWWRYMQNKKNILRVTEEESYRNRETLVASVTQTLLKKGFVLNSLYWTEITDNHNCLYMLVDNSEYMGRFDYMCRFNYVDEEEEEFPIKVELLESATGHSMYKNSWRIREDLNNMETISTYIGAEIGTHIILRIQFLIKQATEV